MSIDEMIEDCIERSEYKAEWKDKMKERFEDLLKTEGICEDISKKLEEIDTEMTS